MDTKLIGRVMVDSGQVMVGDPCYLDGFVTHEANGFAIDFGKKEGPFGYSYEGACQATCSPSMAGELGGGKAVASSSGYGDGKYPVYADYDRNGRVVALHVYFEDDPNEEDEDEECPECGSDGDECAGGCVYADDPEDDCSLCGEPQDYCDCG